jgi:hypothetical protein
MCTVGVQFAVRGSSELHQLLDDISNDPVIVVVAVFELTQGFMIGIQRYLALALQVHQGRSWLHDLEILWRKLRRQTRGTRLHEKHTNRPFKGNIS